MTHTANTEKEKLPTCMSAHSVPGQPNFFWDETSKRMPLGGRYDMSVHGNMFQENIKLEILKIFQFENFEFQYQYI